MTPDKDKMASRRHALKCLAYGGAGTLFTLAGVEKIHIDKQGFAHVPKGPGIGARIDWDLVERYKVCEI